MRAIDRKLLRDLRRVAAQAAAIAVLVASAVAVFVGSVATYRALGRSQAVSVADMAANYVRWRARWQLAK